MQIKKYILESKDVERASYIWNMAGSMLMAFQSVIMLMILTRAVGLVEAGIFTIAYANANLFLTIGKYGMRNFQVSDARHQFSFREYLNSRTITTLAMIAVSIVYVAWAAMSNDYNMEKTITIIVMCVFKAADAIEDIYNGKHQQEGRLDIASKGMTLRMIITIIIFGAGLLILRNLLYALIVATIVTYGLLLVFIKWTKDAWNGIYDTEEKGGMGKLLKLCFPLFASSFLSFYIGNAPKYAIDANLNDELQACYGFIAMPVFVVGLLNGFIFNPVIFKMSQLWKEQKKKEFIKRFLIQVGIVGVITLVCLVGAFLLGIPVLSILYNTDLAPYKTELMILMLGGGLLGLSGLFNTVITIMRCQKSLVWIYGIVAVLALVLSNYIVKAYAMMGAAVLYLLLMGVLCLCLCALFLKKIATKQKEAIK